MFFFFFSGSIYGKLLFTEIPILALKQGRPNCGPRNDLVRPATSLRIIGVAKGGARAPPQLQYHQ